MKVSEFLRKARALIRKGWWQGGYHNEAETRFCASGAIDRVARACKWGASYKSPAHGAEAFLHQSLPKQYRTNVDYNDAPKRTKKQVLAWFDRAIAKALKAEAVK